MKTKGLQIYFDPYQADSRSVGTAHLYLAMESSGDGGVTLSTILTPDQIRTLAAEAHEAADRCEAILADIAANQPSAQQPTTIHGIETVGIPAFLARHEET
jgi:hypothetical protein